VVLRIPPEIPADAVRAAPLPPLISTAAAATRPARRSRIERPAAAALVEAAVVESAEKPRQHSTHANVKPNPDLAPKGEDEHTLA